MGELVSLEEFREQRDAEELEEMKDRLSEIIDGTVDTSETVGYYPHWYIYGVSSSDMNSQHENPMATWSEILRACIRRLTCGKI